jgi:SAM-dependent methyltransferase
MDPKQRFSDRVENYIRYRPGYPPEVIQLLERECGLRAGAVVADIGAGTGLLAERFLDLGCRVYGVEPNAGMRAAGEHLLAKYALYTSVAGSAEASGLPDSCADFVTAGQAFHWFQPEQAGLELRRILRPGGWVVLVWNERKIDSTPFLRAYEDLLLRYATDYLEVNHRNTEEDPHLIPAFFGGAYRQAQFDNRQLFDLVGVRGRLLSSSYAPLSTDPSYAAMLAYLEEIFARHQREGMVEFEYDTRVFYGHLE